MVSFRYLQSRRCMVLQYTLYRMCSGSWLGRQVSEHIMCHCFRPAVSFLSILRHHTWLAGLTRPEDRTSLPRPSQAFCRLARPQICFSVDGSIRFKISRLAWLVGGRQNFSFGAFIIFAAGPRVAAHGAPIDKYQYRSASRPHLNRPLNLVARDAPPCLVFWPPAQPASISSNYIVTK